MPSLSCVKNSQTRGAFSSGGWGLHIRLVSRCHRSHVMSRQCPRFASNCNVTSVPKYPRCKAIWREGTWKTSDSVWGQKWLTKSSLREIRAAIFKTRPSNNRTLNTKKGNPKCIFQNLSIKNHRVNPSSPLHPCSDCQVNSERIIIAISLPKSQKLQSSFATNLRRSKVLKCLGGPHHLHRDTHKDKWHQHHLALSPNLLH